MSIERLQQQRPYPNFKLGNSPEVERDEGSSIIFNIGSLHKRATDFWAGRTLFHSCAERQVFDPANQFVYHSWQLSAARDCIMSIYHFGKTLEGIDESLGRCPIIRGLIDLKNKKKARKLFEDRFPSYIPLRNALAHSAERTKTSKDSLRHSTKSINKIDFGKEFSFEFSKGSSFLMGDSIHGTQFISSWNGAVIKCDIGDQSGMCLDRIIDEYWSSFDGIIDRVKQPEPIVTSSSRSTINS